MNKITKTILFTFMAVLIAANVALFCSSINIGDQINGLEKKTAEYHRENLTLEKKVSEMTSLKFAADSAKILGFDKTAAPSFLEKLAVAKL